MTQKPRNSDGLVAQQVVAFGSDDEGLPETTAKQRPWVQVDLNEIWNLYADSIEVKGLSLQQILRTKTRSREGDCGEGSANFWPGKFQAMYCQQASSGFEDELHINMVSDASRLLTRDTVVTAFYSPDRDMAGYGCSQVLKTARTFPGEIDCDGVVEKMLAQKKADPVAAYRVCQGLSNQLKHLTRSVLPLKKFLCDDPALAPLSSKSLRMCIGGVITFVDKEDRENQVTVDLDKLSALPVLVLGMDQGSPGMAAAGWLHGCFMGQFYYDPFHRLARDMKGAMTSAPRSVRARLQMAQLCSRYLWGLFYKPFRQGSFHQDKTELLEMFFEFRDTGP